jgi:hypothetical protein
MQLGAFREAGEVKGSDLVCYLANATDTKCHVDCPSEYAGVAATFDGNSAAFTTQHNDAATLRQLRNKVRVCPSCGKPCAFTLAHCNSCSTDISQVEITFRPNIFMCFVFGIKPFKIAIRYQDAKSLVFDDLLSLSTCHLNTIPTHAYIPDFRYLLTRPAEGLTLINSMYDGCFGVLKSQFWANATWRHKYVRDSDGMDDDAIRSLVAAGFNYPPSQYQLHLQFITLPLTPFHYGAFLKKHHFTKGRFIPVEYARAVLALGIQYEVNDDTSLEDIFAFFESKGVSYDAIFDRLYASYDVAHQRVANYAPEDFGGLVKGDVYHAFPDRPSEEIKDVKALNTRDKAALENYGRPADHSGAKPVYFGTFYAHAKQAGELEDWTVSQANL